ncbi:hypothetical protein [Streptomyces europaeiscabiei]|uniref:hypothetical protein n=1 Tax=Streptomyces europaeiscabiei TaxID=146819 RepID=UPI0029AC5899|nr:hypothetical protein [Streptomyces europaeiscabiei]MDX3695050.1 hypothetical protein [Streptomyces europaeiscabiei]
MEYPYVRVSVFGVSRADLRTEHPLTEEDICSAYGEQPVYITKDAGSVTVTFDDAGPVCTYFAQRPADWTGQSDHPSLNG